MTSPSQPETTSEIIPTQFADLGLPEDILDAVEATGYTTPTPIQAATIPAVLAGNDVVGLAQTGTGKTAAFSLPTLARLAENPELDYRKTQVLILAPTRELAMQVCEALQTYATNLPQLRILPIYGGAHYKPQLEGLKKGATIVVGTPGRVIDHLNRGSLKLGDLQTLVLDEADEMLRMGFIEDVEQILEHTPETRQVVLFSATMPPEINKIAKRYLQDPVNVRIQSETTTAPTITQEYWPVDRGKNRKLVALEKFLSIKPFDAAIIFSRTKAGTEDLADQLTRWGYRAAALNGDLNQHQREKTVEQLKSGSLDIIVATDVAARGLDVRRISLVINYDMSQDVETYTHRIGRTGRAGATGAALLFVTGKEKYMIRQIEKKTRSTLTRVDLPTAAEIRSQYFDDTVNKLKAQASDATLTNEFADLIEHLTYDSGLDVATLAQLLAAQHFRGTPLDPKQYAKAVSLEKSGGKPEKSRRTPDTRRDAREDKRLPRDTKSKQARNSKTKTPDTAQQETKLRLKPDAKAKPSKKKSTTTTSDMPMEAYTIQLGKNQGVQAKHVVGCIANEAGIESRYIQNIDIQADYTTLELPEGMPKQLFQQLKKARILGQKTNLSKS